MQNFYAKLAVILSGIVAVGFLAWAGVVWNSSDKLVVVLGSLREDVSEMRVRQEYVVDRVKKIEKKLDSWRNHGSKDYP